MIKTRQITKSLAVLLLLAVSIFAVNLKNEDSRRYEAFRVNLKFD
jgi:hypothetical protein